MYIERANMDCLGIAGPGTFDMGLTSAEGKKLECFFMLKKINSIGI
jgi:hypothetical protein